jgi:enoyl-CoA hydratase/carnithine racemase
VNGPIVVTRHDGWAEVRIDREAKRNAMNRAARTGLADAFAALEDMRAILLTGSGQSFCSGMDLKERQEDTAQGINTSNEEWISVLLSIRRHPAIFIAAVNGIALGGGSTLINMCDLAIASSDASIGCPEMSFSTYPAMAGPAIQLSGVTRKQAAWLVLTTNRIDGATAQSWGMVNEHVTPEQLLPRAAELAAQIARFDPIALSESKQALDRIPAPISDWAQAMDYGRIVNAAIRSRSIAAQQVAGQNISSKVKE